MTSVAVFLAGHDAVFVALPELSGIQALTSPKKNHPVASHPFFMA